MTSRASRGGAVSRGWSREGHREGAGLTRGYPDSIFARAPVFGPCFFVSVKAPV